MPAWIAPRIAAGSAPCSAIKSLTGSVSRTPRSRKRRWTPQSQTPQWLPNQLLLRLSRLSPATRHEPNLSKHQRHGLSSCACPRGINNTCIPSNAGSAAAVPMHRSATCHRVARNTALSTYSLSEIPSLVASSLINLLAWLDSFTCIRTFPVRGRPRGRFFAAFFTL